MNKTLTLLSGATGLGAGVDVSPGVDLATFEAAGSTTAGTGAATVVIQVSLDRVNWLTLGTITLTLGTAATSDGFASNAKWTYTRANVTAISGTGAVVSAYMGV